MHTSVGTYLMAMAYPLHELANSSAVQGRDLKCPFIHVGLSVDHSCDDPFIWSCYGTLIRMLMTCLESVTPPPLPWIFWIVHSFLPSSSSVPCARMRMVQCLLQTEPSPVAYSHHLMQSSICISPITRKRRFSDQSHFSQGFVLCSKEKDFLTI